MPGFIVLIVTNYLYMNIEILFFIQWFMITLMTHVNRNTQNISQVLRGTLR